MIINEIEDIFNCKQRDTMIQLGQGNRNSRCGCHLTSEEGRWCDMDTFQVISLMIAFGMLLISLISLIVNLTKDNNKGKK